MKNSFTYHLPTNVIYGIGSIRDMGKYISGRKTILITSKGFEKRGLIDEVKSLTDNIVKVVSSINSHPDFKDLEIIYNSIHKVDHEVILAIGGGSVIDAAKFFSVWRAGKDFKFTEGLARGDESKQNYEITPLISVPTTSGTGSEVTPWATVWDGKEKKKYSLHLPNLFSEFAIYDPTLTLTLPKDITIQTSLDTLSHALESIWNKNATPITVSYAIKSAKIVVEYLPKLVNDLDNIKYRDLIMKACMYAGFAFSQTQTALAHGMSYYITANKGVDHGIACSFTLPLLIDSVIGKYTFIDDALIEIFGELSSRKLRKVFKELNISTEFSDYGITDEELETLKLSLKNNLRASNSLVSI